jgi:hypothetical protein
MDISNCRISSPNGLIGGRVGLPDQQVICKRIEEHFGRGKTIGRIRQTVYRGIKRVDRHFKLMIVASNQPARPE